MTFHLIVAAFDNTQCNDSLSDMINIANPTGAYLAHLRRDIDAERLTAFTCHSLPWNAPTAVIREMLIFTVSLPLLMVERSFRKNLTYCV